ncbi:ras guanine nucleotide exchange factor domain-containing protein [Flammula alnicola]|nr:ras guanine nucleotide exchange factor domain-containing protein [Flammula alnicola]
MSAAHELPGLPSLPPLALPSHPESTLGSVTPPVPKAKEPSHFLQSPALSFAESFSTAYTSPSREEEDETTRLGPSSLAPPQNLRKSVSVDSFAQYSREGSRSQSNESSEPPRNLVYGIQVETQAHSDKPAWSPRHRGESLSSMHRDYDSSFPLDSDVDRYDPISLPAIERFRHQSLKGQDPSKTFIRGGELPLPSRAQNSSSATTPNDRERESLPSISSTSSLQSASRRGNAYVTPSAGRMRSGSLGYNPSSSSKRTVVNPHNPPPIRSSVSNSNKDIILAVIGTTGCGKSTVIRKGLSGYGLVESSVISEASNSSGLPRYVRRTGIVTLEEPASPGGSPHDQVIEVIEVEVQTTNNGLLKWPQGLPPIDGIIICYDSSHKSSYQPVEGLLKGYRSMILPIMVLGCKADLEHEVQPFDVLAMLKQYDTGLIEVSNTSDSGKGKMKQSFQYLLKAILRQRGSDRIIDNRNPATPDFLYKGAPSGDSWTHTPTSSSSIPSFNGPSVPVNTSIPNPSKPSSSAPHLDSVTPVSPGYQPSTGDLLHEIQLSKSRDSQDDTVVESEDAVNNNDSAENSPAPAEEVSPPIPEEKKVKKEPRPSQWADLDDLLDKLLFLAVSGDDPTFTTHFLLTYRRFATPRSVLLAMQKRMRQLDNPSGDPMFACFAQLRICHLLETWIRDYAHDFAVKGTAGALNALIKSIISKTHLLHYGSEFLPFLEQLPGLVDEDSAWALKVEILDTDSDDYAPEDEDDEETRIDETESFETAGSPQAPSSSPKIIFPSRERKASLPLPRALLSPQTNGLHPTTYDQSPKQHIRDLTKLAQDVLNTDSDDIAQEITRQGVRRFLAIKPRDWLHYTFVSGRKTDSEPITAFNTMSNHLADWVVSLILCHERPRNRARQIEKFVEIAQRLRQMNNYSALRAFVAGINNASDDPTMEQFKARSPDHAKNLMSWDVLLQQIRAHRAYRLALRNSKGACIPALEVHMSDLIRAHEGNEDTNPSYPSKTHWGKFNMMGRFITSTLQCQAQCRNSNDYDFPERPYIAELFVRRPVMSTEMQKSRLKSQDYDYDDVQPTIPISQPKDIAGLRKLFFW